MSRRARSMVGLFLLSAVSVYSPAQAPPQTQCSLSSPGTGASLFELSASSGTPIPKEPLKSYVFKNDQALVIRLSDINPFAFQCSVSTNSQPFQETAISSFLGIIGGG